MATAPAPSIPQTLWERIEDRFTRPMSGNEWDIASAAFPRQLRMYHRGVITDRELARFIRSN